MFTNLLSQLHNAQMLELFKAGWTLSTACVAWISLFYRDIILYYSWNTADYALDKMKILVQSYSILET